jgi:hypothetical protein
LLLYLGGFEVYSFLLDASGIGIGIGTAVAFALFFTSLQNPLWFFQSFILFSKKRQRDEVVNDE